MAPVLYKLGTACVRWAWVVIGFWVVLLVGVSIAVSSIGENLNDNLTLPGTDSQAATDLLKDEFPEQANGSVPIVFVAPKGADINDKKYSDAIGKAVTAYAAEKDEFYSVVSPYSEDGSDQISKDKSTAYVALNLKSSPSDLTVDDAQAILDTAKPAEKSGLAVSAGGYVGDQLSAPSSRTSEIVGMIAAVIILLLTFGSLVAMAMPVTTAIFGLGVGLSLLSLFSTVADVPTSAPALATMIGLGVGIDYGLFIVTQHRAQLATGMDARESAARATATAGGAVVFAGGTVIIALVSLLAAGIPLVGSLGTTAAIVVFVAVLAAVTLLPAMLALIGQKIHFGRLPWHHVAQPNPNRTAWHGWAEAVTSKRWIAIVASVAILAVLSIPLFSMTLGQTDDGSAQPGSEARKSFDALAAGFGPGINGPLLVAVDMSKPATNDKAQLDKAEQQQAQMQAAPPGTVSATQEKQVSEQIAFYKSKSSDPRLQDMMKDIEKTKDVQSVSQPLVNDSGSAALFQVIPDSAPSDEATADLVDALRETVLPDATKGNDMTAHVGGATAGYKDLATEISENLPLVIALVLFLSFFLLLLAFRSILVPVKAVAMNLLSIAASFGVVSYVFTHDWSAKLVGLEGPVPIVSFVPLMMFAILFGLSMDYEVFLMTHVREEYLASGDARRAVVEGLAGTARVITSAALIMVSVFCAFVLSGDPNIKQFGVGMAAAVLIDATIVRCVLVPGLMAVMGDAAWWLPRWLDRLLPNFSIEGKEWFAQRDR